MRLPARVFAAFGVMGLAACAAWAEPPTATSNVAGMTRTPASGPGADYPVVIGDPYTVGGVLFTPSDALNVDEVGYATLDDQNVAGVTAAHRTLPLPSYIEVTSLDSGRTALVRVERRGPMSLTSVVALSPLALAQLGIGEGAPVRVRRVNPPESDRADLRAGGEAGLRMDTPEGLLQALKRKLAPAGYVPPAASEREETPQIPAIATIDPDAKTAEQGQATSEMPSTVTQEPARQGSFVVQLGAFSNSTNAERLAARVSGFIDRRGKLARVRTGPYATRSDAEQALAKLRAQGYSDARIEIVR